MSGGMTRSLGARLRSRDLGVFTWAELQAAYPNGGGALAALPHGTMATVTDACAAIVTVVPNPAKTRWIAQNGHALLFAYAGDLGAPVHTWSGATGKASLPGGGPTIAASLLAAGDTLRFSILLRKTNANATAAWKIRLGTTGTYAIDAIVHGDTITNVTNRQARGLEEVTFADTTSFFTTDWLQPQNQATAPGADYTTNVNTAAAMKAIVEVSSIHASDVVDLVYFRAEWIAN